MFVYVVGGTAESVTSFPFTCHTIYEAGRRIYHLNMFFQPLESPPPPEEEAEEKKSEENKPEEEKFEVQLRRPKTASRTPRNEEGALGRPRPLSRPPDTLQKINEDEGEVGSRNSRTGYNLSGYLYKINPSTINKIHMSALKGLGSSPKKRWFVYSDSVCKLYYYNQKNDSEPLGMIDIALATFFFDPENKNEGQFSIR